MQKHLTCHSQLDLHFSQGITYVASEASGAFTYRAFIFTDVLH